MEEAQNPRDGKHLVNQPGELLGFLRRALGTFSKRLVDILVSGIGLLMLSPIFAIIAIAIKRDSDGPIYFRADRVGRFGKHFRMLKFRTMYECPESYIGPPLTANGDHRVTPFGHWLRDTKLNELPQLWNVFIGKMSLVGPRPEDPEFVSQWPEEVQQKILGVRPGITSPASIIYYNEEEILDRSDFLDQYVKLIMPDKVRLDMLYLENHGFLMDLDVFFLTIFAILARIEKRKIKEKTIFSGPFYLFYSQHFSWFIIDLFVAFTSVGIAGLAWRSSQTLELGFINAVLLAFGIALLLSLTNAILGLHRIVWRYASPAMILDIALSVFVSVVVVYILDRLFFPEFILPLSFILNYSLLMIIGMVAIRYRDRLVTGLSDRLMKYQKDRKMLGERVLVVGAGDGGEMAVWLLQKSGYGAAFSIVGFVDDDYRKQRGQIAGYPVLGVTADVPALVEKHKIGLILFSISKIKTPQQKRILEICQQTGVRMVEIPDLLRVIKEKPANPQKEETA